MTYMFIKQWKPKPSWMVMSLEERKAFVERAQKFLAPLAKMGLETIAWFQVDPNEKINNCSFHFCSVYRAKDKKVVDEFQKAMIDFNWYDHFEQENAIGIAESPGKVLTRVMTLPQEKK